MKSLTTPILNRQMSSRFNMFRTFPPLPNIQIHTFRIVEAKSSKEHAEYLIEMQLDGHYFSRWRRFSEIYRFVNSLNRNQFRQSMVVWQPIEAHSRWFNRLELSYLHKRCRMLEEFAYMLLIECSNAHPLADLMEC
ncbi:unnamed protein product [Peronospora belbahrii]|uniref:PX domain-containing protein n=1 Tax=Peronospora belbahrii TaxID=622444 RepID=A0ABN8D390_9STRA|nr:unnamed protein product [Peronospora belbahrii]